MAVYGIIAEFNPLHRGHEYIINCAKERGDAVVCALGSCFVQRGDTAVYTKYDRARAAVACGADAVAEMPCVYTMSTAQNFAFCGVYTLANAGCDTVIFGSATGDVEKIERAAEILMSPEYKAALEATADCGETFAARRERAAAACGADPEVLRRPNDNLGVEYIIAARKAGLPLKFETVKRLGAGHDGEAKDGYASASYIRELIKNGETGKAALYIPERARFLLERPVSDIRRAERAILALLRTRTREELSRLPDLSEGIENRLYEAIRTADSLEGLYAAVKSKRYTLSRVRRLALSAALGFDGAFFLKPPPYTRILGGGEKWAEAGKNAGKLCPTVSRVSAIEALGEEAKALFKTECLAADIYALSFETPLPCGGEYTAKYVK